MDFKGVLVKAEAIAERAKADVAKAANAVDGAVAKLEKDAPEVEAVANAVVPGASKYMQLGLSAVESIATVLDSGNAAAKQNLLNAGLDESLVSTIEAELANLKKLA
jgi:hypothetical protein